MYNGIGPAVFNMVSSFWKMLALCALLCLAPGLVHSAQPIRILALGDSLTAGYGLRQSEGFTAQLENALSTNNPPVLVLNAGVSGDTTSGGLARLDWALGDRPDAVILALGANDGLRAIDPEVTRNNLTAILDRLQSEGLPVLLAGIYAPRNLGESYTAAFDRIYPELAEAYDAVLYPFFLQGVVTRPELNQADGLHPNAQGVAVIVDGIKPYVLELIERVKNGQGRNQNGAR